MWKPVILLLLAAPFLGACERYTEQTSPCFGRNAKPVVSRAAFSFTSPLTVADSAAASDNAIAASSVIAATENTAAKECNFEELSRPV